MKKPKQTGRTGTNRPTWYTETSIGLGLTQNAWETKSGMAVRKEWTCDTLKMNLASGPAEQFSKCGGRSTIFEV